MSKEEIIKALKKSIVNYVDDISEEEIELTDSLTDIGLDSIERGDILIDTMDDLGVKMSLIDFKNASNLGDIVEIFSTNFSKGMV
ncbi:MAG: hypothetical protein GX319_00400 [Clostridiales bacterium]|jgi:polyketide biosynthesis acyl carrier protein|nr:hypothetical protein [Clostridiales bacterium]